MTKHIMPEIKKMNIYVYEIKTSHKVLGCRCYKNRFQILKQILSLEINTQPGMTNLSLVPEIANYQVLLSQTS